jgi:mannose-1-phosphate guanylyltransferase/mannose-6-phosphate isomerase
MNCKNTLLICDNEEQVLVGLGLENIIAVAMSDAVLVSHKNMSQDVKRVVSTIKEKGITQAESFRKEHKPWGWFEILSKGNFFQVKRIFIKPNNSISLQSHKYRSEHWVVVSGNAKVTINDKICNITKGESVFVPLGAIHRLENTKATPVTLIEVQTGTYLGEDDIVRYQDQYSRTN